MSPKKLRRVNRWLFLIVPVLLFLTLFFAFRKTTVDATLQAKLNTANIKLGQALQDNKELKTNLYDVYLIKEDYRKELNDIDGLLYFKKMPIGGADLNLVDSDQMTIKTAQNIVSSFKDLQGSFQDMKNFLMTRKTMIDDVPLAYPIRGDGVVRVSSGFGPRPNPFNPKLQDFHPGVDLVADIGTVVQATADGVVERVEVSDSLGNVVYIKHALGYTTVYAHLSQVAVEIGQKVKRGDKVGEVGDTGETTGPHLHYEIHVGDHPVDPMNFLSTTP
jgi:murein DD-endopeptidase MepM/ murein hydrolase activator NlpD